MAAVSGVLLLPTLLALIFFTSCVVSDHSPAHPPSLPPQSPADEFSPSPSSQVAPESAPTPGGSFSSPPAPPPPDLAPISPPPGAAPSMPPSTPPAEVGDVSHENQPNAGDMKSESGSSGGMSSGQKVGVAIGVIAAACLIGVCSLVYKKRRQNVQRAQYGYAARRELL